MNEPIQKQALAALQAMIGKRLWVVSHYSYLSSVRDCESCHGEGGAMIPGTKVIAQCQDCEGERQREYHDPDELQLSQKEIRGVRLEVSVGECTRRGITWNFNNTGYCPSGIDYAAYETKEQAIEDALQWPQVKRREWKVILLDGQTKTVIEPPACD